MEQAEFTGAELPAISEHEPLARYTSWRLGGPARFFANVSSPGELLAGLRWAAERALPLLILGGGSNVLIADAGFPGLVLRYRNQELRVEEREDQISLYVGAGAPTAGTARRITAQGYRGLQWAEGLPGTIGGAVYGNAGCYGGDIASQLERAWLLLPDGSLEVWDVERFAYRYRSSALKRQSAPGRGQPGAVVLAAEFRLTRDDPEVLRSEMEAIALSRRSRTPSGSSCGSVFKNPPGDAAGRLIEAAGLKGRQIGAVVVSEKHANYLTNLGGASSDDVLRLISLIREQVLRQLGVELELEVQLVGFETEGSGV